MPDPVMVPVRQPAADSSRADDSVRPRSLRMPNPPTRADCAVGPAEEALVPHEGVLVVVGPNGSGKTRLGAALEAAAPLPQLGANPSIGNAPRFGSRTLVRIGAQRAVALPEHINLTSQDDAQSQFNQGAANAGSNTRLSGDPATGQMQDYAALVQLLFAENNGTATAFHAAARATAATAPTTHAALEVPQSVLERVVEVWQALYPHRRLDFSGQRLRARPAAPDPVADLGPNGRVVMENMSGPAAPVPREVGPPTEYGAGQLSDGERAGFYLIGHALLANAGTTLLIDEPETYLHPDLQRRLWDALEAARPDCAFVYLTHNLDFAASRRGAPKIVVRDYQPQRLVLTGATVPVNGIGYPAAAIRGQFWTWEMIGPTAGVPDDVVLRIAGSRRPTLFVEGDAGSLDAPLYRAIYPDYDVVPAGPCEAVIRNVRALRDVPRAHHLAPVGIIDPDDRDATERAELAADGVQALGYAQVENVYIDERVFRAVLAYLREPNPDPRVAELRRRIAQRLDRERDGLVRRRALRAVDRRVAAWAAPAAQEPPGDEAGFTAAFSRAAGNGDPARVVAEAFAAAARDVDAARSALAAAPAATTGTAPLPPAERAGQGPDAREDDDPAPGDPAYRQALVVLRNKGVEADAAAAANLHGPAVYRRLALAVLDDCPELRAALADVVPPIRTV